MRILDQVNLIQDHTILIREIRTAGINVQEEDQSIMVNFNLARWLVDMGKGMLLGCGTECVPLGKSLIC